MRVLCVPVFPTLVSTGLFAPVALMAGLAGCSMGSTGPEATKSTSATAPSPARGETPKDRDHVDPDGIVRRGEILSQGDALSVSAVMAQAESLDGRTVKVTGTVGRVCGKSGCWFELKGKDAPAGIRITSKGYRFFVPSKAGGMTATLEGDLKVRMLDVATAQHYADDAAEGSGKPAPKVKGPVPEVSIAAVGLEMRAGKDG